MELDRIDHMLLLALSQRGRASHQQLSEEIGRSPTSIARRQRQLEDAGIIGGYSAEVDLGALGFGVTIHLKMTLESQSSETLAAFEQAIRESPSVTQCELMSGSDDYYVTVMVMTRSGQGGARGSDASISMWWRDAWKSGFPSRHSGCMTSRFNW